MVFKINRAKVARSLVAAPVVGDDVKVVKSPHEPCEGTSSIERAVDADERGRGMLDTTFGDRQSLDG